MANDIRVSLLNSLHPDYVMYSDMWQMINCLYEGGVKLQMNVDKFIIRRPKELYDVFFERTRRLTYQDILQSCISWHLSKMFERDPTIDLKSGSQQLSGFIENVDNKGTSYVKWGRNLLETMMLYRRAFVLVDLPKNDGSLPLLTKYDASVAGIDKPYLAMFDPRSVLNWQCDRYGNLDWIVLKTVTLDKKSWLDEAAVYVNWWAFDRSKYYHYRYTVKDADKSQTSLATVTDLMNQNKIYGQESSADLIDSGPHAMTDMNQVPIKVCELPMDLWHANRAYLHLLEHVDALNGFSWKLFMCNLPQLVIYTDDTVTGQTLSETGYLNFKPNDKVEWLEPKASSFQTSANHLDSTRQEIYRSFHLQAQAKQSSATADGASGFSKEVDMMPAVDILNALGDILRSSMQEVLVNVKLVAGEPNTDADRPDVNGFQFETKPTLRDIEKFNTANDAGIIRKSKTLEKTLAADIAMDMVSGKNDDLKETIRKEIESAPTIFETELDDAKQLASASGKEGGPDPAQIRADDFKVRNARTSAVKEVNDLATSAD